MVDLTIYQYSVWCLPLSNKMAIAFSSPCSLILAYFHTHLHAHILLILIFLHSVLPHRLCPHSCWSLHQTHIDFVIFSSFILYRHLYQLRTLSFWMLIPLTNTILYFYQLFPFSVPYYLLTYVYSTSKFQSIHYHYLHAMCLFFFPYPCVIHTIGSHSLPPSTNNL